MTKKHFVILVSGGVNTSQAHQTAINFINAVYDCGHSVVQVFFYREAVGVASNLLSLPTDEVDLTDKWAALSEQFKVPLMVCVAAAVRRGVIDVVEAKNNDIPWVSLNTAFEVSGLGEFVSASLMADQVMVFK